jgi:hypothetical protein
MFRYHFFRGEENFVSFNPESNVPPQRGEVSFAS